MKECHEEWVELLCGSTTALQTEPLLHMLWICSFIIVIPIKHKKWNPR